MNTGAMFASNQACISAIERNGWRHRRDVAAGALPDEVAVSAGETMIVQIGLRNAADRGEIALRQRIDKGLAVRHRRTGWIAAEDRLSEGASTKNPT